MIGRLLQSKRAYVFLFFCYAIGLWGFSVPLTGDQKTYLTIALEMRERSSFVIPTLFGEPNFLKPPLQYWATLAGWKVFGFGLFGALLPSVLALIGASALVRKLSGRKDHLGALLFSATLASMTYGTTAQMEIWVVLFYLWAWLEWVSGRVFRTFLATGLLAWVKGPLYPALFVFSIAFEAALKRELREKILNRRFISALLLGVLLGLAWYLLAARTHYREMMSMFFLRENFAKISTSHGTPQGLWGEFLGTLFPLLPLFLTLLFTPEFRAALVRNRVFWLSYGLLPALFFTVFPYRVNTYLYLLTPLVVWILIESETGVQRIRKVSFAFAALAASALILLLFRLKSGNWISLPLFLSFVFLLPCWALAHLRASTAGVAVTSVLLVSLIRLSAVGLGEADLLGLRAELQSRPETRPAFFMEHEDIWHEVGLLSAAVETRIAVLRNRDEARIHLASGGALLLEPEQDLSGVPLSCVDWPRLKKRIKFPVRELLLRGLSISDPGLIRVFRICRGGT